MPQGRTWEQILQLAKETTWATGVNPTVVIPVTGGGGGPQSEEIFDEGRRGMPAMDFEGFQGSGHGEFSMEGFAYPDRFGHNLMAIFGSDTMTGSADPWTHTFKLAADPPSYTIEEALMAGAAGGQRFVGSKAGTLGLSFDSGSGVLTYTQQWMSKLPAKVTPTVVSIGTVVRTWPSWSATITSTGMTNRVISADVNISRELHVVHTADNSQSPHAINVGAMRVEGTITLALEDLSDLDLYLADTHQPLVITWAYTPAAGTLKELTMTMTNVVFTAAPITFNRESVSVSNQLSFRAIANATDGSATVHSPLQVVLKNGQGTAY